MALVEITTKAVLKSAGPHGFAEAVVHLANPGALVPVPIIKTAAESRTTATFADDATFAGITFAHPQVWEVELRLDVTGPTGADIKVQWVVPAVTGFAGFTRWCSGPAAATTATSDTSVVSSARDGTDLVTYGTTADATVRTAILERFLIDTRLAVDTVAITLQWAQATATGTTTIRAGSYMVGRRLL